MMFGWLWSRHTPLASAVNLPRSVTLDLEPLEDRDVPARVWYVSPTGNDSAAGTYAQPVASAAAFASKLSAGDEVHYRGGTYWLNEPISLTRSGTAAAPIKVMAQPG